MFTDDNNDDYPMHTGWGNYGGQTGTNNTGNAQDYGGLTPAADRPLYRYAGSPQIFWCPADAGDSLNPQVKTCFGGWGNSYLIQWRSDSFRIKKVSASPLFPPSDYAGRPSKQSDFLVSPVNKLITADWPWHANRSVEDPRTVWHNYKGRRYEMVLFADAHVEFTHFPTEMETWATAQPSPTNRWW